MKQEIQDKNRPGRKTYVPAKVKVIEVAAHGVLCQSGGINSMSIDEDGGDYFK